MNHCFYSKSILDLNNLLKSFFIYQCSQRASTHFYNQFDAMREAMEIGVNALNGLLLISTEKILDTKKWTICVNALNGLLLISTLKIEAELKQQ